jgi:hypothetical protein
MITFKTLKAAIIFIYLHRRDTIELSLFVREISKYGICKFYGEWFAIDEYGILD